MKVLVVAPHADDETLGCGGTLLRLRDERAVSEVHWLLVTDVSTAAGYAPERVAERDREIAAVAARLGAAGVHRLGFAPARLDEMAMSDVIGAMAGVVDRVRPDTLFVPWRYDAHTDHRVAFDAIAACTKSFRYPSVKRVLAYETPSETEFALDPGAVAFRPNLWVDISAQLDAKLELLASYPSEMAAFPFPRSVTAVRALAQWRGSTAGVAAAEAFVLLKSIH